MKPILISLLALLGLLLMSCSPAHQTTAPERIPVVLDTDIGTDVDDTWALAYLLRNPELDLKMVLTANGNTEYRARLAAKFLEVSGHSEIPVGIGPNTGSYGEYQLPWVGDYQLADYPGTIHEDGVQAFIDLVDNSPTPITMIAVGPLTNIPAILERRPDIASKVHFIGMHGSIDIGYGGSGEPVPEANVVSNVPAFRTALEADWLSFKITPLDTCGLVVLEGENYQRVRNSEDPMLVALMENYEVWSKLVTWETVDYIEVRSSTLFDLVAVYMAFDDALLEYETIPLSVTDDGYTVRDPEGIPTKTAIRWKDLDAYEKHIADRLTQTESTDSH